MSDMAAIESPCTLVCVIDPVTRLCFGCGRTGDEIAAWISMTPQARREVMAALPARMEGIVRPARRETRRARQAADREES